ncbi:DUF3592 domain-containing protein [Tropicibacter oceani]|uniref:DUF3592 domain-containing protein n=1 Tax=Tropicibacter oceani TaxID=3058420 RepID=A0ABY8QEI0_9RHOB|nr:DUF3592 domain-containing protein [Tropicibacter oceani]WGW03044.1 hypothetical protein QF118_14035 [Tropicibacter oceani]
MAKVTLDRPVPIHKLYLRMGGWFSLAFLGSLLVLTLVSHFALGLAIRFETEGRQTTARIMDKYYTESTDSDGDREVTHYLVLDYMTNSGAQMEISRSVSLSVYNRARVHDTMPIWYLDSEPDRTELTQGANRSAATVTQIIALVFGTLMLGGLWYSGSRAIAAVRARRFGAEETAEVTEIAATSVTINNRRMYRLKWREASGRTGQSLMYRASALAGFGPGSQITVYQGIKRAWWQGDTGPRAPEQPLPDRRDDPMLK